MKVLFLCADRPVRIHEHESDQRNKEDDSEDNRDPVEILLNDACTTLSRIQRCLDHLRNARPLARMEQDEDNQTCARNEQQNQQYYQ